MTFELSTLDRTSHDERISLLWRSAAFALQQGKSAQRYLNELEQEQAKCEAYGCWKEGR